ncbi:MAG: hypothetical protein KDA32_11870 [Phycisphaerales bacterium]|nr:hypothetical protein [Phycisphaerales bacterium]
MTIIRDKRLATLLLTIVTLTTGVSWADDPKPEKKPVRNIKEWDLPKNGLAIGGYDPVAYFPEGGGKATKGKPDISFKHEGVTYFFANPTNRKRFEQNPARYEPAHGGWCSWAMKDGDKTQPDPKSFIVKDDRLFLFYDGIFGDTRAKWQKQSHDEQAKQADAAWKRISGEEPRKSPEKKEK